MWKVRYKKSIKKDLQKASPEIRPLLRRAIEEKLMEDPAKFGTPLRRSLRGFLKLRVGDWRIIYSIERKQVIVYVIKIGHRREVYRKMNRNPARK